MRKDSKRFDLLASTSFCGAVAAGLLTAFAPAAYAQDAAVTQEAEASDAAEQVTEVTVVGSRIRKDTYNSASPIQVVTRNEATAAGLTSTAAILQSTAVTGGSEQINNAFGGFVTDGGPGANTIGLRGLGPGRTLVLINGRRVSPAGARGAVGSADLNVLPNALIGRIEVLRDGASAIYGSDAIGGVVNVITRSIDGVIVEGQTSIPTAGGGEQFRGSIVGGKTWDRLTVQGSLEYFEHQELTLRNRDWAHCSLDGLRDPETGQSLDYVDPFTGKPKCHTLNNNGVTINTIGTRSVAGRPGPGTTGAAFTRWRPNGLVTTGLPGFEGVSTNSRDTFEPRMLNESLLSPVKIWTAFGQFSYDLPEFANSEVYGELLLNKRLSQQTGYRQTIIDYAAGSALLPTNLRGLTGQTNVTTSEFITGGLYGVRAFIGMGNDTSRQEVDYVKATGGIKGDLRFASGWQYDASVQYSKSDAMYMFESFLTSRLANSMNVSAAASGVPSALINNGMTCNVNNANPTAANCVPAPVLTEAVLGGNIPQAWRDYVFVPVVGNTTYEETTFTFDVNGDLFTLPAGSVAAAIGVEHRRAEINDQPDPNSVNGNLYNFTSAEPTVGKDSVSEIYAEVNIPILKDVPFAKNLTIELAGRYTDYDSYGDDTTYKAGIVWTPADFLTLRATKGTSFRAPALYEQFQGATSGFRQATTDPCYEYVTKANPTVKANCASENLPLQDYGTGAPGTLDFRAVAGTTVLSLGGSGVGLKAETSENITIGAVFKPTFLPSTYGDIAFAVDYFDIEITDGVAQAGAAYLISNCYNDPKFRNGGQFCAFLTERDPITKAFTVYNGYTNLATQTVRGYDFNLRWEKEFGKFKVLSNAAVTKFDEQGLKANAEADLFDYNGNVSSPNLTGSFDISVRWDQWRVRYGTEWVNGRDDYEYQGEDKATSIYDLDVDDYFLHNASVQFSNADWTATLGVRNLTDEKPPTVSGLNGVFNVVGNAPVSSQYDYYGRQVFLSLSKRF